MSTWIAWATLATNCWLPPITLACRRSSFLSTSSCSSLSNVNRPIKNGSITTAYKEHAQPNARHSSEINDDLLEGSIGIAALSLLPPPPLLPLLLLLRATVGVL